ncbi:probable sodium/metabolite cotransporter BASS4, chloroplastic [Impatiens glandulifera]|uniref:probable sodium/metabolite cotransporter BASS4, chloroplastic n=1 Tax=Impatiens glandulifera TaxID=253017 RepID=UPI001FB145DF|nr:probable sodium/metabolite cotransporter BASS4, chloroplastic [Impatiens glandulifera]
MAHNLRLSSPFVAVTFPPKPKCKTHLLPPSQILCFVKHSHNLLHTHFSIAGKSYRSSGAIRAIHRSNQLGSGGGGGEEQPVGVSDSSTVFNWTASFLNFASNNFLPLALISGVTLGLANPTLGCIADSYGLSKFGPFGIFIISGLTLRSKEIGEAMEAWPAAIFGLGSILILTPIFSRLVLMLRLQPQEFVTGLAIFCCMPTTLSSGVALTRLAGGNSALALAMTVISNMLGILIVPFSISKFIADGVGISFPTKQLFKSLVLTLLVPLILGKACRELFRGVADTVDKNRKFLSIMNALLLSLVPWIQVSRSRPLLLEVKAEVFLIAIGMGALLHLILLAFNVIAIKGLSAMTGGDKSLFAKRENAIALILVASQKTLPVMIAVVEPLKGVFGESGLLILPCVAAHMNQIIFDSFLINYLPRNNSLEVAKTA